MIERLYFYFNSLEKRERYIFSFGVVFVILFIGIFFITLPNYNSLKRLEKRVQTEIENYNQLRKLAGEYTTLKKNFPAKSPLTLAEINNISQQAGIKENLQSIRPVNIQDKESFELIFKKVNPALLSDFIKKVKNKGYKVYFISIENPRQNNNLNVRVVIGG